MRIKREYGRILSVETQMRGSALAADVAAGATTITVDDAGDFDEDGGWLLIGDQLVEFATVDDDAGTITLATALTAAGEDGDPVHVWSPLYEETVDYQVAQVQLDGEFDNLDPVEAEVAEGVDDLWEGDRGGPGESCTLHRIAADEWEVVAVGGRPRSSRTGGGMRFEADDVYEVNDADVAADQAVLRLSHRPIEESLKAFWDGEFQEPTEYSIDYEARTVTFPLDGVVRAGDRLAVHYAYLAGISTPSLPTDTVAFVGGAADRGSSTVSAHLPADTQAGDLIVLAGFAYWHSDNPEAVPAATGAGNGDFVQVAAVIGTGEEKPAEPGVRYKITGRLWCRYATEADAAGRVVTVAAGATVGLGVMVFRGATYTASSTDASTNGGGFVSVPAVAFGGATGGYVAGFAAAAGGTGQGAEINFFDFQPEQIVHYDFPPCVTAVPMPQARGAGGAVGVLTNQDRKVDVSMWASCGLALAIERA